MNLTPVISSLHFHKLVLSQNLYSLVLYIIYFFVDLFRERKTIKTNILLYALLGDRRGDSGGVTDKYSSMYDDD